MAADILKRASQRFQSHLLDDHKKNIELAKHVEDVKAAIGQIEVRLAACQSLRGFDRLRTFLDAIDRMTKPLDVLSNGVPFLPYIWVC